jgi:hypothetical protein
MSKKADGQGDGRNQRAFHLVSSFTKKQVNQKLKQITNLGEPR